MHRKVAIIQNTITGNGRTRVISSIIEILNAKGIVPDIFSHTSTSPQVIKSTLGMNIRFNLMKVPYPKLKKGAIYVPLLFNLMLSLKYNLKGYDLLINSNNLHLFISKSIRCFAYMHNCPKFFLETIPKGSRPLWWILYSMPLRWAYRLESIGDHVDVAANSNFTLTMIRKSYSLDKSAAKVLYPPVDLEYFWSTENKRINAICTLGRFAQNKGQLEQIKLAKEFPKLLFNIIGFVAKEEHSNSYYQQCKNYVAENKLKNVRLYKNLSIEKTKQLLRTSKYFLHTKDNELFGISTVEAISAGCIPIVPDSGGQIEVVPNRNLRFNNMKETSYILRRLEKMNIRNIRTELQEHVKRFSQDRFKSEITIILENLLE